MTLVSSIGFAAFSRRTGVDSSFSPLSAVLKLRIASPRPVATLGKRLPPNKTRTIAKIIVSSQAPIPNITHPEGCVYVKALTQFSEKNSTINFSNCISIGSAMRMARTLIEAVGIDSASLDAQLLLSWVTKKSSLEIHLGQKDLLSDHEAAAFFVLVRRRLSFEPIAYITGTKEFFGLDLVVSPDVLIPRPDTEIIVEECLKRISLDSDQEIIELCIGSGAIAIALLHERPLIRVTATDISLAALAIASKNAQNHLVANRLTLYHGDLLSPVPVDQKAALIVANPPYIGTHEMATLSSNVRDYEPALALDAGDEEGLTFYRRIIADAPAYLKPGGYLVLEIGFNQAFAIKKLVNALWKSCDVFKDLAGNDRCIVLQKH